MYVFIVFCHKSGIYADIFNQMEKRIKLSAFAKSQGITYQAAWKMWERGDIEGIKLDSGTILVTGWTQKTSGTPRAVIYCRISHPNLKEEMDKKIAGAQEYSEAKGYEVTNIVKEVVSGMSSDRPKLSEIFEKDNWDILVVDDSREIAHFNFDLVKTAVGLSGKRIEVINEKFIPEDNLLMELSQRILSWTKQIIGMGSQKNAVIEIIKKLNY